MQNQNKRTPSTSRWPMSTTPPLTATGHTEKTAVGRGLGDFGVSSLCLLVYLFLVQRNQLHLRMSVTTKKKHVERELYEDFSLPQEHQSIVRVLKPCGNNLHQVTTADGDVFLASMPHKFRKHVWIKRGDYVVTEPIPEGNKVRAEIVRILMKDHIRHIIANNMWPAAFSGQCEKEEEKLCNVPQEISDSKNSLSDSDNDDLMKNPNRPRVLLDSGSDSDSESREGSDCGDSESSDCDNNEDSDS